MLPKGPGKGQRKEKNLFSEHPSEHESFTDVDGLVWLDLFLKHQCLRFRPKVQSARFPITFGYSVIIRVLLRSVIKLYLIDGSISVETFPAPCSGELEALVTNTEIAWGGRICFALGNIRKYILLQTVFSTAGDLRIGSPRDSHPIIHLTTYNF